MFFFNIILRRNTFMGTLSTSQLSQDRQKELSSQINWDNEDCDIESEEEFEQCFEERIPNFLRIEKGASKHIWDERTYKSCGYAPRKK